MDIFDGRLAQAMLLVDGEPFDSKDFIYELKLDGIRCLAYLDDKTELRNKRNKNVTAIYPELSEMYKQVNKKCILDGEIIVAVNGIPDFFEIQRRSLMTNPFKIELASKNKPVSFVCYDVLYVDGKEVMDEPLMKRKEIIEDIIREENRVLSISRYIEEKGINFYQLAVNKSLEGVVAKKKKSYYYMGKRTKDWLKFKHMIDEDFVICGVVKDDKTGIKSIVLGAYHNDNFIYQGHVALGLSSDASKRILEFARMNEIAPLFDDKGEETMWIKPELVCTVKYMMRTHANHLRQPVFKGLRNDKTAKSCII